MGEFGESPIIPAAGPNQAETAPALREAFDFTAMSAENVVQVCRTINALTREHFDLQKDMRDAFYHGLDYLAQQDPDRAVVAYQALADDKEAETRGTAAISVYSYAGYDKYRAFPIWVRLLHDQDRDVRQHAAESIAWGLNEGTIDQTEGNLLRSLVIDQADLEYS